MKRTVSKYIASRLVRRKTDFILTPFRSNKKAGGQHRDKASTCMKITDRITGLSAEGKDERYQIQNKRDAFNRLIDKMIAYYEKEEKQQRTQELCNLPKDRTYDFKAGLCTNHINGKSYDLNKILNGELEELIADMHSYREGVLLSSTTKQTVSSKEMLDM